MLKGIIFDLDGTLVNLPINWKELKLDVYNALGFYPEYYEFQNLPKEEKRIIYPILERHELDILNREIRPINSTMTFLRNSTFNDMKTALVTLNGRRIVAKIISRFKLQFDSIITREISHSREEQLRIVLKDLELQEEEVLFVGNRVEDKEAATKIGIQYKDVKEL